ncbi:family 1 glycosylhydrolase, partial [Klebsiella pneumoniae]|uniref:family 1 glycosylhydrolase n=1 Tax=Klebsiella pneumoniae TaxID=573 RepID=UPI001330E553
KYQAIQKGEIGIVLVSHWFEPYSSTQEDKKAAQQAIDFMLGWALHPLTYGHYPKSMRSLVGERLPKFTPDQSEMVKGSIDLLGLNYYTARYASYISSPNKVN